MGMWDTGDVRQGSWLGSFMFEQVCVEVMETVNLTSQLDVLPRGILADFVGKLLQLEVQLIEQAMDAGDAVGIRHAVHLSDRVQ